MNHAMTKEEYRQQIATDVAEFEQAGGEIDVLPAQLDATQVKKRAYKRTENHQQREYRSFLEEIEQAIA